MRYVIDLFHTSDGVHGHITREGCGEPEPFTGWLELLRLLEPATAGDPDASCGAPRRDAPRSFT